MANVFDDCNPSPVGNVGSDIRKDLFVRYAKYREGRFGMAPWTVE